MSARRPWVVTPHGPLVELTENLWVVESAVPNVPTTRRMAIVKLSTGRLLFLHAVPLDEASLAKVLAWGEPRYLAIAHEQHGVDADAFAKKLGLKLYGPKEQVRQLRAKFDVDGYFEDLPLDPAFEIVRVGGCTTGEPALIVRSAGCSSIVFSDAYTNILHAGWLMGLTGYVGPDRCPPLYRLRFIDDTAALKAFFERIAGTPNLKHLVPCHGELRSVGAAATLREVAAGL